MEIDSKSDGHGAWIILAGISPLFVFSNQVSLGLVFGGTFLLVHSASATLALLLPARLGKHKILFLAVMGGTLVASFAASFIRAIDPFLFETTSRQIFLVPFTLPVLRVSMLPVSMADRERTLENLVRGAVYAGVIVMVGAIREFLASGAVSLGNLETFSTLLPIASQPAGALLILGLVAAALKALLEKMKGSQS